jgi:hypothetical protein
MQGNGMGARRLDRRAHSLADGIEIDERTFRCAKGFALLHRYDDRLDSDTYLQDGPLE